MPVYRPGLTPVYGEYPVQEDAYRPGHPPLEYFPNKPVKCPEPPVFRILQDSMSEMQDSKRFSRADFSSFSVVKCDFFHEIVWDSMEGQ